MELGTEEKKKGNTWLTKHQLAMYLCIDTPRIQANCRPAIINIARGGTKNIAKGTKKSRYMQNDISHATTNSLPIAPYVK